MLWIFLKKTTNTLCLYKYKGDLSCIHRGSKPPFIDTFDFENWYRRVKKNKIFKKLKVISLRHVKDKYLPKTFIWGRRRRRRRRRFFFRFLKKRRRLSLQDRNVYMKFKERYLKCFKNKLNTKKLDGLSTTVSYKYKRLANKHNRRYLPIKAIKIQRPYRSNEDFDKMVFFNKKLPEIGVNVGSRIKVGKRKRRPIVLRKYKYLSSKRVGKVKHENKVFFNKNKFDLFFYKKNRLTKLKFVKKKKELLVPKSIIFLKKKKSNNRAKFFCHNFFKKKLLKLSRLEWDFYDAEAEETFFARSDYPGKSMLFFKNFKKYLKRFKYYKKKDLRKIAWNYNFFFLKRRKKLFLWKRFLNDRVFYKIRRLQNKLSRCGEFGWELFVHFFKYKFFIKKYSSHKDWPSDIIKNHKLIKLLMEVTELDRYEIMTYEFGTTFKRMLLKWNNRTAVFRDYGLFFQKNKDGFVIKKNRKYRDNSKYLGFFNKKKLPIYGKKLLDNKLDARYSSIKSGNYKTLLYLRGSYNKNTITRTLLLKNKRIMVSNKNRIKIVLAKSKKHRRFTRFARRVCHSILKIVKVWDPNNLKSMHLANRADRFFRNLRNRLRRTKRRSANFAFKVKVNQILSRNTFTNRMVVRRSSNRPLLTPNTNHKLKAFYFFSKKSFVSFQGLYFIWKRKGNLLDRVFISRRKNVFKFRVKRKLKNVFYKNLIKLSKPFSAQKEFFIKKHKTNSRISLNYKCYKGHFMDKFRRKLSKNVIYKLPRSSNFYAKKYLPLSRKKVNSLAYMGKPKHKISTRNRGLLKSKGTLIGRLYKKYRGRRRRMRSTNSLLFPKKKIKKFATTIRLAKFRRNKRRKGRVYEDPISFFKKKKYKLIKQGVCPVSINLSASYVRDNSLKILKKSKSINNLHRVLNSKLFIKKKKSHKFLFFFNKIVRFLFLLKSTGCVNLYKPTCIDFFFKKYFFIKNPQEVFIFLKRLKRTIIFSIKKKNIRHIRIHGIGYEYGRRRNTGISYWKGFAKSYRSIGGSVDI